MLDFSNIFPSVLNWLIVTIMAVTGIAFFKYIFARMRTPYVSDLVASI